MNEINDYKSVINQIFLEAIRSSVTDYENRNLDIYGIFFGRGSNINCFENNIHIPEFKIPFSNSIILYNFYKSMHLDEELHWNKFEISYMNGVDQKLNFIWDQEYYDLRMKEAEKNIKRRR